MPTAPGIFKGTAKQQRGTSTERGYDSHWARISRQYRAAHPVCESCDESPSDDTDHIRPFKNKADQRRTAHSNLQALCRKCHHIKTQHGGWIMDVTFVTGVSGSGKSTYVEAHRQPGDLVWDMDVIAQGLIDGMGRKADKPSDLLHVLYGMRRAVLQGIRLGTINRNAWVIWTEETEARKQAPASAIFVRCSK